MFQQSGMGVWTTFRPEEFLNMAAIVVYYGDAVPSCKKRVFCLNFRDLLQIPSSEARMRHVQRHKRKKGKLGG